LLHALKRTRPEMIPGKIIWFVTVSVAVLSPVLLFALNGGDFTWIASESLAYRFFHSARLYKSEDDTAWLPQGQLITAIQHGINYFLLERLGGSLEHLRSTLNIFCYATLLIIDVIIVIALAVSAASRALTWRDRVTLVVVACSPYLSISSVSFVVWPDYLYLDAALMTIALLSFQLNWRQTTPGGRKLAAFGAGAFVGILAGNKMSMILLGVPLVVAIILSRPLGIGPIAVRSILSIVGALLALGLVLLVYGLFRIDWLLSVSSAWYRFISNPGGDAGFLRDLWSIRYFGLAVMSLSWIPVFPLIVWQLIKDGATPKELGTVAAIVIGCVACGFYIWKRPAGTTLWESGASLLTFSAMFLTMAKPSHLTRRVAFGLAGSMAVALLVARPDVLIRSWASQSRAIGDEQWSFFAQATALVPANGIRYFIPNNNYQRGDVFIILLKGAADFPTWEVGKNGQWIVDKFAPGLQFVYESGAAPERVPDDSLVVWFDFPHLRRIPELLPQLAEALSRPEVETITRALPAARIDGHIARIARRASKE
jgi:hypothetical protein